VILTHDGESFPKTSADDGNNLFKPAERIAYADTLDIDLYVSVHCDSYDADASVKGTRIYYSLGTSHESDSSMAAGCILRGINTALPESKKATVKAMENEAAYYVVRACKVPSVLIEMGFVSNRTDAQNMLDPAWRDTFAAGIAAGVVSFFAE
jgi:N-acetylmuramoyl-L-alanine amidase